LANSQEDGLLQEISARPVVRIPLQSADVESVHNDDND
jgi:hypothetical protein